MSCQLLTYFIVVLLWSHVLPQYTHTEGYLAEYFAVVNQHEPTTNCAKYQFTNVDLAEKSFSVSCSDLLFGECALNIFKLTDDASYAIGTKAPKDLATFAKNAKTLLNQQTLVPFENWGRVSNQALEAYNRLMNAGLKDYLHEMWAQACDHSLWFYSHSLACCVDQMIGVYLNKKRMWPSELLHFSGGGCPRCGDQTYPDNTCAKNTNAKSGTGTDCWFHCCQNVVRYTSYALAGVTANFISCTTAEDTQCHTGTDPTWHTKYFQVKTSDWTSISCLLLPKYTEVGGITSGLL